jgi:hypothetical protein
MNPGANEVVRRAWLVGMPGSLIGNDSRGRPSGRERMKAATTWVAWDVVTTKADLAIATQGAEFFARAAEHSEGDRQRLLTEASKGYATASQVMLQIHERLPKSRSGELPVEDSLLQVGIASLRPLARLVRAAERQALAALVQLVDADPLPTMQEDPLLRRDRGRVLYRWQADFSKGVYDLTLTNEQFTRTIVDGRDTEGEQFDVEHGVRHEPEWVAVLEIVDGGGLYHIAQQANADNDWTLVVRVDDESTPYDNSTEIVIWEVPAE